VSDLFGGDAPPPRRSRHTDAVTRSQMYLKLGRTMAARPQVAGKWDPHPAGLTKDETAILLGVTQSLAQQALEQFCGTGLAQKTQFSRRAVGGTLQPVYDLTQKGWSMFPKPVQESE
jgi:hypothetical protein